MKRSEAAGDRPAKSSTWPAGGRRRGIASVARRMRVNTEDEDTTLPSVAGRGGRVRACAAMAARSAISASAASWRSSSRAASCSCSTALPARRSACSRWHSD